MDRSGWISRAALGGVRGGLRGGLRGYRLGGLLGGFLGGLLLIAPGTQGVAQAAAPGTGTRAQVAAARADLHKGRVTDTRHHSFETLVRPGGISIYLYALGRGPLAADGASGEITLLRADGSRTAVPLVVARPPRRSRIVYFCPMHPDVVRRKPGVCRKCGGMRLPAQNRLYAKLDPALALPDSAAVHIRGLDGIVEREVRFTIGLGPGGSRRSG